MISKNFLFLPFCWAAVLSSSARAEDASSSQSQIRTHVHKQSEEDETPPQISLDIVYTGEVGGVASGGLKRGARYLDNLDIAAEADLAQLAGLKRTTAFLYGLYNNGRSLSNLAGDAQVNSNIETGVKVFRLYEAWINHQFGDGASLKIGLYDLNSEFDALEASGLFISSAHGIGTDISQSGLNGPSIFPVTSLAARFDIAPADGWKVRAAVLDGVPGNPNRPKRTAIKLGDGDGALIVGEVEAPLKGGKLP